MTAIHWAIEYRSTRVVELMCNANLEGFNLNTRSSTCETPLIEACINGDIRTIELLLSVPGVNVNMVNRRRQSPLVAAIYSGKTGNIDAILKAKDLNVNSAPGTSSPLQEACFSGTVEAVSKLPTIDGIDVDAEVSMGRTALADAWCPSTPSREPIMELFCKAQGLRLEDMLGNGETIAEFISTLDWPKRSTWYSDRDGRTEYKERLNRLIAGRREYNGQIRKLKASKTAQASH